MAGKSKQQRNKITDPFLFIYIHIIHHPKYHQLKGNSVKLLFDLYGQYSGFNNGDLSCSWVAMKKCGWKSKETLYSALKELLDNKFIELTRQGNFYKCSLYAVTWLAIDECKGKLDVKPTNTPSNTFKK